MIYLDHNATAPLAPEAAAAMEPFLTGARPANPGSAHAAGAAARSAADAARARVAALINARPDEVVFTSGGTESDNAAIWGAALARPDRRTVVVSAVEHAAVREPADRLARVLGVRVVVVPVGPDGLVDPGRVAEAVGPDTAVVSVMWANNETGVVQPVADIAGLVRDRGAWLHVDAVQAVGRVPVDFASCGADLLSVSSHKLHGPAGAGALIVRKGVRIEPLIAGGPQEAGRRGGTENVAGTVGFGAAAELAARWLADGGPMRLAELRDRLERGVLAAVPGAVVTAGASPRLCNTTNIRFPGRRAEAVLMGLDELGVCVSVGAACSSGSLRPSHVLTAMGLSDAEARSAVRFSLGRGNTADEIDRAVAAVAEVVARLPVGGDPADDLLLD
jgi:cysteine desulfurase